MRHTQFLLTFVLCFTSFSAHAEDHGLSSVKSLEQAKKHPIVVSRPAAAFFEGALLGNGGIGAVVTTRPDAVVIHFGHTDVWDI